MAVDATISTPYGAVSSSQLPLSGKQGTSLLSINSGYNTTFSPVSPLDAQET